MKLKSYVDLHRSEISSNIESLVTEKSRDDLKIPLYNDALIRLSSFSTQGKMMRGVMVLAASEMFGQDPTKVVNVASAVELVHSGLLIHDDILDDDYLRRGNKTIFAQYEELEGSKFYGQSMAICVGDTAFFLAFELISSSDIQAEIKADIVSYFSRELQKVGAAEMEDFHYGATDDEPSIDEILNMYRLKSARYTFSMPLTIGAKVARKDDATIELLDKFGENLGIVFQIVDDALGITGDEKVTGKPVGSDIRQNKKTVFRRYLYDAVSDRTELDSIFGKADITTSQVDRIKALAQELKVQEKIDELVQIHLKEAREILGKLDINDEFAEFFEDLIAYNISRDK